MPQDNIIVGKVALSEGTFGLPPINSRWLDAKKGEAQFSFPAIPSEFYTAIGAVVAFWGHFESTFDEVLSSFVEADRKTDDIGWRRRPYKTRRRLLKSKIGRRFGGNIAQVLGDLLDESAEYHWKRNLIAHGQFDIINLPDLPVSAIGERKGRLVELPISYDMLEQLYHQIGILHGNFSVCFRPEDEPGPLRPQEVSQLQSFLQKHPPNLPTPRTLTPHD